MLTCYFEVCLKIPLSKNSNHIQARILHRTSDNVPQKIELCSAKATSQWTQFSGVKLIFFVSYRRLKPQKHSASIALYFFGFL